MSTFILAFVIFASAFALLSLGWLVRRRPLRGGCGGHKGLGERLACTRCDCEADGEKRIRAVTLLR